MFKLQDHVSQFCFQNKNMYQMGNCKHGVCHSVALPFTLKKYLKAKEEIWKFKYFTMQKYNLQKNHQNPSRYHNSI
jgi:hypothetical protein